MRREIETTERSRPLKVLNDDGAPGSVLRFHKLGFWKKGVRMPAHDEIDPGNPLSQRLVLIESDVSHSNDDIRLLSQFGNKLRSGLEWLFHRQVAFSGVVGSCVVSHQSEERESNSADLSNRVGLIQERIVFFDKRVRGKQREMRGVSQFFDLIERVAVLMIPGTCEVVTEGVHHSDIGVSMILRRERGSIANIACVDEKGFVALLCADFANERSTPRGAPDVLPKFQFRDVRTGLNRLRIAEGKQMTMGVVGM